MIQGIRDMPMSETTRALIDRNSNINGDIIIIILEGQTAIERFLYESDIVAFRGSLIEASHLLTNGARKASLYPSNMSIESSLASHIPTYYLPIMAVTECQHWMARFNGFAVREMDYHKAIAFNRGELTICPEHFTHVRNTDTRGFDKAIALLQGSQILYMDVETEAIDPTKGGVVCLSIGTDASTVICFEFRSFTHQIVPLHIVTGLASLIAGKQIVMQNGIFDISFLEHEGIHIEPAQYHADVMWMHKALHKEDLHNLGHIVSQYGTTPYWKGGFKDRLGSIYSMDKRQLFDYNCRDSKVLAEVYQSMRTKMEGLETWDDFQSATMALVRDTLGPKPFTIKSIHKDHGLPFNPRKRAEILAFLCLRTKKTDLETLMQLRIALCRAKPFNAEFNRHLWMLQVYKTGTKRITAHQGHHLVKINAAKGIPQGRLAFMHKGPRKALKAMLLAEPCRLTSAQIDMTPCPLPDLETICAQIIKETGGRIALCYGTKAIIALRDGITLDDTYTEEGNDTSKQTMDAD